MKRTSDLQVVLQVAYTEVMDRMKKLELIQRSLGIRHKLKVHESMKAPDTHEDLSLMLLSKWELEDGLRAIEEILAESRQSSVSYKKSQIEKEGVRGAKAHLEQVPH